MWCQLMWTLQRLHREIFTWQSLCHPHVLPMVGLFVVDPDGPLRDVCMVSPWMVNGNLRDYIKSQKYQVCIINTLVRAKLCHVESYSSSSSSFLRLPGDCNICIPKISYTGISERYVAAFPASLLPAGSRRLQVNVLVSHDGHAVLADFGLSKLSIVGSAPSTTFTNSNIYWCAPELSDEDDIVRTRESDVWSFGCVCFEVSHLLRPPIAKESQLIAATKAYTGLKPFHDVKNGHRIPSLVRKGLRPPCPSIISSTEQYSLMCECWHDAPQSRPAAAYIVSRFSEIVGRKCTIEDCTACSRR
jgi:serine/threonine protein kinase